jgi:protein-S-isoprenylcysteine O-methyltransferase Ste14
VSNPRSRAEPLREKKGEHPFGDAGQVLLLVVFLVIWVVDSFFLHESTFLSDYVPLFVRLFVLGFAFVMALYLFRSGHVVVSHEQRPSEVVNVGAFRYVRHPLYLASMITYLGLAASTVSLLSFAVVLGMFIFYDYIAGYEEKLLEAKFGDKYRTYKERTGKWVPKLHLRDR